MSGFFAELHRMLDRFLTPAAKLILIINVIVCLVMIILSINPTAIAGALLLLGQTPALSVMRGCVWQFVTYAFVHMEPFHLLFNMLILWFFAPALENRWGTRTFWSFYLTVAIGAALFHALFTLVLRIGESHVPVIGASGVMYGIMLAFAAYQPEQPVILWFVFPIKIKYLVIILGLFNFMMSASPVMSATSNVSYLTHLTGLGVAYLWMARHHRDWDIRRWRWTRGWR